MTCPNGAFLLRTYNKWLCVARFRIVKTRLESRHGIARSKDAGKDNFISFCKISLSHLHVVSCLPWQIFNQASPNVVPRRILLSFSTSIHWTHKGGLVGWLYLFIPCCIGQLSASDGMPGITCKGESYVTWQSVPWPLVLVAFGPVTRQFTVACAVEGAAGFMAVKESWRKTPRSILPSRAYPQWPPCLSLEPAS